MSYTPHFKPGEWKAVCYVCGFLYHSSQLKLRWDGVYVCHEDWEIRQPQDFVRGEAEEQAPEWTQPEAPNNLSTPYPNLTSVVVGTPSIYVGGVLQTPGVDYTITLPQGLITFTTAPSAGLTIAWTGTWLDNASVQVPYTQYPLYTANGWFTQYQIYGAN